MTPTPSEQAAAVLNLIERGVIGWNEPDVVEVLSGALKAGTRRNSRKPRSNTMLKTSEQAPSARMTKAERDRVSKIRIDLAREGIIPERWELEVLARGAVVRYGDKEFSFSTLSEWS